MEYTVLLKKRTNHVTKQVSLTHSEQIVPSILKALASHAYDDVTLVCNGGDKVQMSSMVLAFLSPRLGNLLKESYEHSQGELCLVLPYADAWDVSVVLANLFLGEGQVDQAQIQKMNHLFNPMGTQFVKATNKPQQHNSSIQSNTETTSNFGGMESQTFSVSDDSFCPSINDSDPLKVEPEVMIKEEPTEMEEVEPSTSSDEQSNLCAITEKYGSMKKYLKFIELKEKQLKAKRFQSSLPNPKPILVKAILPKAILPKPILPKSTFQPVTLCQAMTMEVCKHCGQDFMLSDTVTKEEFKRHMQSHVLEKMSCECDFGGESDSEKSFHIRCFHLGHFGCKQCGRTFTSRSSLFDHHQLNHSDNKNEKIISKKNNIEVGETFANKEEVENQVQQYSDSNFSPFVSHSSGFRQRDLKYRMVYKCPFGVYRKSQSAGIRQVTSKYVGCPVVMNINQQKDNSFVVSKAVLDHQEHEVGEEMYAKYRKKMTKDQEEAVIAFLESDPSNQEVSLFLKDITGKDYTIRDAGALARKLRKRNK